MLDLYRITIAQKNIGILGFLVDLSFFIGWKSTNIATSVEVPALPKVLDFIVIVGVHF